MTEVTLLTSDGIAPKYKGQNKVNPTATGTSEMADAIIAEMG